MSSCLLAAVKLKRYFLQIPLLASNTMQGECTIEVPLLKRNGLLGNPSLISPTPLGKVVIAECEVYYAKYKLLKPEVYSWWQDFASSGGMMVPNRIDYEWLWPEKFDRKQLPAGHT